MKTYRVVYDIAVDDAVPETHVENIAKDTASNLRWGLVHDLDIYPQNLARPVIKPYGIKRLDAPPPPEQPARLLGLGPGPGLDR